MRGGGWSGEEEGGETDMCSKHLDAQLSASNCRPRDKASLRGTERVAVELTGSEWNRWANKIKKRRS